ELIMRLRDRVAIITGGASGIGRGIAVRFCQEGAAVAICARRQDRLEQTAGEIVMDGRTALPVPCDVTDEEQVRRMVERVADHFGRIDVLVNAVGVRGAVGDVTRLSMEEWWEAFQVNTTGPLLCARHVIPRMREIGGGAILNIGSL